MIPKTHDIRLLLDNIRSVHNVGSIFRTAETLGIKHIYLGGTTPAPSDRFGRKRKDFAKVALGAEEIIKWELLEDVKVNKLLIKLKKEGFKVVALEQSENSTDYRKVKVEDKMLIVLGNEVEGVRKKFLGMADEIAEIPMAGQKESLNVSVASGIFLFRIFH